MKFEFDAVNFIENKSIEALRGTTVRSWEIQYHSQEPRTLKCFLNLFEIVNSLAMFAEVNRNPLALCVLHKDPQIFSQIQ